MEQLNEGSHMVVYCWIENTPKEPYAVTRITVVTFQSMIKII